MKGHPVLRLEDLGRRVNASEDALSYAIENIERAYNQQMAALAIALKLSILGTEHLIETERELAEDEIFELRIKHKNAMQREQQIKDDRAYAESYYCDNPIKRLWRRLLWSRPTCDCSS